MSDELRVGFVTGTTPDKWARAWRDQRRGPLTLVPITEEDQEDVVRRGVVDMALVRLPVDTDELHCVRLYDELPVVVAGRATWSRRPTRSLSPTWSTNSWCGRTRPDGDRRSTSWRGHPCRSRRRSRLSRRAPASSWCRCRSPGCSTARTSSPRGHRPPADDGRLGVAARARRRADAGVRRRRQGPDRQLHAWLGARRQPLGCRPCQRSSPRPPAGST